MMLKQLFFCACSMNFFCQIQNLTLKSTLKIFETMIKMKLKNVFHKQQQIYLQRSCLLVPEYFDTPEQAKSLVRRPLLTLSKYSRYFCPKNSQNLGYPTDQAPYFSDQGPSRILRIAADFLHIIFSSLAFFLLSNFNQFIHICSNYKISFSDFFNKIG